MSRVFLVLAVLSVTIFCVVDCVQTQESEVRHLPKFAWLVLIVLFPVVGSAAWLLAGRARHRGRVERARRRPSAPQRPVAPDDDPTFLAGLDRTNEDRRRLAEWEDDLQAREQDLGRGTPEDESRTDDGSESDGPGDAPATRS